jgi:dienelactone hydrolase
MKSDSQSTRLQQVVGHWLPRMMVAGLTHGDITRLIEETGEWPNWCAAWSAEGALHLAMGEEAEGAGRLLTAGEAYRRAALFYHFGQFMFFDDLTQKWAAADSKAAAYARAAPFLQPPAQAVSAPFEGGVLKGYLRRPDDTAAPLVILVPGSDSTKEEFASMEAHFLARGLATFSFDGPGQGEGRKDHHLRADWGPVLAAVLEALDGTEARTGRVGVMGMAFGGHLALQAAAAVPEIAAVASMNGFFDLGAFWDDLPEVYRANMGFALGGETMDETAERARAFSLRGAAMPDCAVLVIHGGRDRIFPVADARKAAEMAGPQAEWVEYPDGNHVCNNIAYKYRPLIADWMAEKLAGGSVQRHGIPTGLRGAANTGIMDQTGRTES